MIKMLFFLITCQLITTSLSASIFGINVASPSNAIKNHFNHIFDGVNFFNHPKQKLSSEFSNPVANPAHGGNDGRKGYGSTYYRAPNKDEEVFSFLPQHGPDFPSKTTSDRNQNYIQYNPPPVNVNSRGSYDNTEEYKPSTFVTSEPYAGKRNNSSSNNIIEHTFDPDAIVFTDSTTEIFDYDSTTTDELLNRIGAPPAIVASLLGGG